MRTTNIVTEFSSYECLPFLTLATPKSGKEIRLAKDSNYLSTYWKEFGSESDYEAFIEGRFTKPLLLTKTGDKVVGAYQGDGSGHMLFLPPPDYANDSFTRYEEKTKKTFWTKDATKFSKRFLAAVVGIYNAIRNSSTETPPPSWVSDSAFRVEVEDKIEKRIGAISEKINSLQIEKAKLCEDLKNAGSLRRLLYEQGTPLELVTVEVLKCFGFQAANFNDGESEFDAVFSSKEGRFIGEVEGKDNRSINIDKFSQLERNIQEDFAKDGVKEYAKGVLFGNAFRLSPLTKRGEFFTDKCLSAAKRTGMALVRTPDLFYPAKYLSENPTDLDFAQRCREAIFQCNGSIVKFPDIPGNAEKPSTILIAENLNAAP